MACIYITLLMYVELLNIFKLPYESRVVFYQQNYSPVWAHVRNYIPTKDESRSTRDFPTHAEQRFLQNGFLSGCWPIVKGQRKGAGRCEGNWGGVGATSLSSEIYVDNRPPLRSVVHTVQTGRCPGADSAEVQHLTQTKEPEMKLAIPGVLVITIPHSLCIATDQFSGYFHEET